MAESLKCNSTLKSFTINAAFTNIGDETGKAMAESLKFNSTLKSFTINANETNIGDETGKALAESLKFNSTLKSFTIHANDTNIGDETGKDLAESLKCNSTLKSFTISAHYTNIGDETGKAMAESLKCNSTLMSFSMYADDTNIGDETGIMESLECNRKLHVQCNVLALLARGSPDCGFHSLKEMAFRRKLFAFFLPPNAVPAKFFVDKGIVENSTCPHASISIDTSNEWQACGSSRVDGSLPDTINVSGGSSQGAGSFEEHSEKEDVNENLSLALLHSKADGPPPLSGDGQVILKITRMAHSEEVRDALLTSPELEYCRARVLEAQCNIKPECAHGATCFVPFTEGQLADLISSGRELAPHHIVALRSDVPAIMSAFAMVPSRKRPRVDNDDTFHDLHYLVRHEEREEEEQEEVPIIVEETWPSTSSSLVFGQVAVEDLGV
jgi:hypothetical protein